MIIKKLRRTFPLMQCINLLLTLLLFIPGVVHAWIIVLDNRAGLQPKIAGPASQSAAEA
jgi:hypothetical protein